MVSVSLRLPSARLSPRTPSRLSRRSPRLPCSRVACDCRTPSSIAPLARLFSTRTVDSPSSLSRQRVTPSRPVEEGGQAGCAVMLPSLPRVGRRHARTGRRRPASWRRVPCERAFHTVSEARARVCVRACAIVSQRLESERLEPREQQQQQQYGCCHSRRRRQRLRRGHEAREQQHEPRRHRWQRRQLRQLRRRQRTGGAVVQDECSQLDA